MNISYQRATGYRTEEVGLRPRGNTVTVDVPSDNPFEDDALAGVSIFTQVSGGMAKPIKDQKSQKIMYRGKPKGLPAAAVKGLVKARVRAVPVGCIRGDGRFIPGLGDTDGVVARKTFAVAPRPVRGFIPGMGALDEAGKSRALAAFRKWDSIGKLQPTDTGYMTDQQFWDNYQGKRTYWEQDTEKRIADEAKPGFWSTFWGEAKGAAKTGVTALQAKASETKARQEAAAAQSKERIEAKKAGVATAQVMAQAEQERTRAATTLGTTKWLVGGGVAVLALGIAAYFLLKPKKA